MGSIYDLQVDGFNWWHTLGAGLAITLLLVGLRALRKAPPGRRGFLVVYVVFAVVFSAMTLYAFIERYRDYRLDLADLRQGRAPVVEGVVHDVDGRRGVETFSVGDVPLFGRGPLEAYGMPKGVAPLGTRALVRVRYGRREGSRFRVLRFEVP